MDNNSLFKVLFLGSSEVGKTSIINAIFNCCEFSEYTPPTISPLTLTSKIPYSLFDIQFTDTVGEPRYRHLNKPFYKIEYTYVLLVYDISSRDTFDELKTFFIPLLENNITTQQSKSYKLVYSFTFN